MTAVTFSVREGKDQGCRFRRISSHGLRVTLEVTGRCNLACRHCFACSQTDELSTEQWVTIIKQLPSVNARKIILTGGEPLLRKDLEVLIATAVDLGIGVDLNTNMSALTPSRATHLWEAGLREMSVSIDGPKEYHDWFRKRTGDFERVIRGIQLATQTGFEVDVHGVCTPGNVHRISDVIDLCAEMGVLSYTLLAVVALGKGVAALQDQIFSLNSEHKSILLQVLLQKRDEYAGKLSIRTVDIFNHPKCDDCPMGESVIGITPVGDLMPCLLADYQPNATENLTHVSIGTAVGMMRQRIQREGRHLACSNSAD